MLDVSRRGEVLGDRDSGGARSEPGPVGPPRKRSCPRADLSFLSDLSDDGTQRARDGHR